MSKYGIRYFDGPDEIRLVQIAGSGRVRVRNHVTGNEWWTKPRGKGWQSFSEPGKLDENYDSEAEASEIAATLAAGTT